ncbi:MAG TPA: restriction endonuclease subunit S [Longimicrobiaceae bacterium]|nr:restriction endonuclease subunit S [Longimicrobiaceae bacterium]
MVETLTQIQMRPHFSTVPPESISDTWRLLPLGTLVDEFRERAGSRDYEVMSCSKIHGIILQSKKFKHRVASKDTSRYKVVPPGTFVYDPMLLWDGSIGRNNYPFSGLVSPAYSVFQHSPEVDPEFLELLLRSPQMIPQYRSISQGTNTRRRKAHFMDFSSIQILLPPLSEQRAIAGVIQAVHRSKKVTEQAIAAAWELKRSLMRHLFTYGPVSIAQTNQVRLEHTEVGPAPEHWRLEEIGSLGEVITGTTPSTKRTEYYGGPYMCISPGDLGLSKYVTTTQKSLSQEGLAVSRALPRNTVLVVCIGGTIGKVGITSAEWSATNQQINAIVPNREIDPHFLYYALSRRTTDLLAMAGRAAIPIVNKSNFLRLRIPVPPLAEQQEIGRLLSVLDDKLEADKARASAIDILFGCLLHHLMTGKLRVHDLPEVADVAG